MRLLGGLLSLASFPKSLKGLLRAFGGRRFRGVLFLFLVVVPSASFFTPSSREQKTSGTTQSALDALSYSAFLIDWTFQHNTLFVIKIKGVLKRDFFRNCVK